MPPTVSPPTPQDLLGHARFVRGLAERLVVDEPGAEDAVQEAYLTALSRPPRMQEGLQTWLGTVTRRLVWARHKSSARRQAREQRAARPESSPAEGLVLS